MPDDADAQLQRLRATMGFIPPEAASQPEQVHAELEVEQAVSMLGRFAHSVVKIDAALPALRVVAKRAQADWERIDYAALPPSIVAYLRTFPPSLMLSIVDCFSSMLEAGSVPESSGPTEGGGGAS